MVVEKSPEELELEEQENAAIRLQGSIRGKKARAEFKDKDARRQWIDYHLKMGEYEEAEQLGWSGKIPEHERARREARAKYEKEQNHKHGVWSPEEIEAASKIEATFKSKKEHEKFLEDREEAARLRWIEYHLAMEEYDLAKELGWEPSDDEDELKHADTQHMMVRKRKAEPEKSTTAQAYDYVEELLTSKKYKEEQARIAAEREAGALTIQTFARIQFARNTVNKLRKKSALMEIFQRSQHRACTTIQTQFRSHSLYKRTVKEQHQAASKLQASKRAQAARLEVEEAREEKKEAVAQEKAKLAQENHASNVIQKQQKTKQAQIRADMLQGWLWKYQQATGIYAKRWLHIDGANIVWEGNPRKKIHISDGIAVTAPFQSERHLTKLRVLKIKEIAGVEIASTDGLEFVIYTQDDLDEIEAYKFRTESRDDLFFWTDGLKFFMPKDAGGMEYWKYLDAELQNEKNKSHQMSEADKKIMEKRQAKKEALAKKQQEFEAKKQKAKGGPSTSTS